MFKTLLQSYKKMMCLASITLYVLPIYADLPKPPDGDMPSGSNDWIDVGGNMAYKGLHYTCIVIGAIILVGTAFGIMKAYHTAREKQEMGHFLGHAIIGLIAAAIGAGLVYAGYIIIPSH